ncbi:hypothetical protein GXW78_07645 [Roseomonas terrae]|uniref:DUF2188 domain-containing protein n=1 Tax=Neoroseomonas terrae TaxID=424799 RepID=A0ABS5EET7_9PROT|nr:hypothetical protein [Neoroseomonas terrae]MBR0649528.1 hypothetical protein [Neoroseomonas terrae]
MTLAWRPDAHGWRAFCGEEQQGIVRVVPYRGQWAWIVDMLPGDIEPQLVGRATFADVEDAKAEAQRQVKEWPTPIEGARRV